MAFSLNTTKNQIKCLYASFPEFRPAYRIILSASLVIEQQTGNGPWTKSEIQTGDVFIVLPHTPAYQMRWRN